MVLIPFNMQKNKLTPTEKKYIKLMKQKYNLDKKTILTYLKK